MNNMVLDTKDDLAWERWEKQFSKIKQPDPVCCNQDMEWFKSDLIGYYYKCLVCGRKVKRKYYHEFYTDSKGRTQLREKRIRLTM